MYPLLIDPFLLIRSPAYSYEDFNEQYLRQALQTDFFRASLFFASQSLYTEIRKKEFDYDELNQNVKITLWKYLNRMCFRALPYGFFSSYSASGWAESSEATLSFSEKEELIVHPDFKVVVDYISNLVKEDFHELKYYTNNSIYQSSKELRFISQAYSAQRKFAIVQLKLAPGLNKLLRFISGGQTKTAIIQFLKQEYGDDAPVADYFSGLLAGQVIVSELTPNVTGMEFNHRCRALLKQYPENELRLLDSFRLILDKQSPDLSLLNDHIDYLMQTQAENSTYSLYEREIEGGLSPGIQTRLTSLIRNIDKLTSGQQADMMSLFKKEFVQKYDRQEIPLMVVLDPSSGIGYENLVSAFDQQNEDFIDDLRVRKEGEAGARWGMVEKMIFRKWNSLKKEGTDKIIITAKDLENLPESRQQLPPGMFVLFKRIDEEIWVDGIGGVSGIELSARFGGPGTAIETALRKICDQETAINNDFVFAEIAYSPNDRTSNINQRGHYYQYEIPVLTHPVLAEPNIIRLSDLVISVKDGNVFLRSVKLNKYVIPRLSSAYNYKISTIPVFRFLCDLQYQGLKSNLSLSLKSLFPDMEYYPRLQLEDAVLSPATWILHEEQLKRAMEGRLNLATELDVPRYFSLIEGDNFLVFDQENAVDLQVFAKCVKNKQSATLAEYVFPANPLLRDKQGKPFASQLLACVINQTKSYQLPSQPAVKFTREYFKVKRSFLPGEEWLYLKVYTHYSLADEILLSLIIPVLKKHKKDNPDFKWFFIRYLDPGHHLRLRFCPGNRQCHTLLADLIRKMQSWWKEGKISDIVVDSYQRELEKYSVELISEVESFFYRDSEFILSVFTCAEPTTAFKLSFAVNSSLRIIQGFIRDKNERNQFLAMALGSMSDEFSKDKEVVRKLDVKYRKFQKELVENQEYLSVRKNRKVWCDFDDMLKELVGRLGSWSEENQYNLLINLVHMHINRIFENTPREYEYLIYHFMKKHQSFLNYTTSDGS